MLKRLFAVAIAVALVACHAPVDSAPDAGPALWAAIDPLGVPDDGGPEDATILMSVAPHRGASLTPTGYGVGCFLSGAAQTPAIHGDAGYVLTDPGDGGCPYYAPAPATFDASDVAYYPIILDSGAGQVLGQLACSQMTLPTGPNISASCSGWGNLGLDGVMSNAGGTGLDGFGLPAYCGREPACNTFGADSGAPVSSITVSVTTYYDGGVQPSGIAISCPDAGAGTYHVSIGATGDNMGAGDFADLGTGLLLVQPGDGGACFFTGQPWDGGVIQYAYGYTYDGTPQGQGALYQVIPYINAAGNVFSIGLEGPPDAASEPVTWTVTADIRSQGWKP